ncbi:MAG: nicotinate phosphoribosyltransferase [Candidatus Marinimicrobia bacterium]|nr:nicotinate phosphoribosyltransferase [Candidatus Neomarinimicrobiota bacterium]
MRNLSLLTDFYELTMMQGYFLSEKRENVVFDYFIRKNPFKGGYTIFAGLEPLLDELSNISFGKGELEYLEDTGLFKPEFLEYLKGFTFSGDLYAVKEGEIVFPNEPVVRVEGNLMETQLIESLLLNFLNFQSLIATKTARIVHAAENKPVLEFGLRRAQGQDGAISAARASYIAGIAATSNTLAGKMYGIPAKGTMAHSWVMSFDSELESFREYAKIYPENCILLVDTYDTLKSGVPNAIKIFKDLQKQGVDDFGIRLDSGDLEYLSKRAREMLDDANCQEAKIFASSELDEKIVEELVDKNSPIDAWGIGTKLITANPDPALSGVYKLVGRENNGKFQPVIKVSNNPVKMTNPGIKNVMRFYDRDGMMKADLIYDENEEDELRNRIDNKDRIRFHHPSIEYAHFDMTDYKYTEKQLKPVMKDGKIIQNHHNLDKLQKHCHDQMHSLHSTHKRFLHPHIYKVSLSNKLNEMKKRLIAEHKKDESF